jgi:hypothetical protein
MALVGNTDAERLLMKRIAASGILLLTGGLLLLNTTGAYDASGGNLFYTAAVAGAEILVAVAFGFTVLAQTWVRRIVCGVIFVGLMWACIENGKLAIQRSFSEVFVDSAEALRAKALVAEAEASEIDGRKVDVRSTAGEDLSRVRDEIATLNLELDLMTSTTRIAEAQTRLAALGLYTGRIDGIRADLTETAMRARGETIRRRLDVLKEREASAGVITGTIDADPAAAKRIEAIRLRTQADEVDYRTVWMHIILIAFEAARSFGVWAFLMVSTVRKQDDIEEHLSDELPPGTTVWRGTDEEWQEIEEALKVHRNVKAGAKKGARTRKIGNKVEAAEKYYRDKIAEFMVAHNAGASTSDIAGQYGLTVPIMRMSYGPYMTPEELAALFGTPTPEVDETPEPVDDPAGPATGDQGGEEKGQA